MYYNHHSGHDVTSYLVYDYFVRRCLIKIGFQFPGEEISCIDAQIYTLIHSTVMDLERRDLELKSGKKK